MASVCVCVCVRKVSLLVSDCVIHPVCSRLRSIIWWPDYDTSNACQKSNPVTSRSGWIGLNPTESNGIQPSQKNLTQSNGSQR